MKVASVITSLVWHHHYREVDCLRSDLSSHEIADVAPFSLRERSYIDYPQLDFDILIPGHPQVLLGKEPI